MAQNNSLLNMATANPASTDVHNNINNLIMKAEMDSKLRQYSMSAYKTPQPITGTIPDVALSPLLTLKSLGSVGRKLLEKIKLRNPVSHYTSGKNVGDIISEGRIKGTSDSFPGKPFYGDRKSVLAKRNKQFENESYASSDEIQFYKDNMPSRSPAVSVTRDPSFLQRAHSHVGTDVQFIMDRDDLIKSGFKINPLAEKGFRKVNMKQSDIKNNLKHYADALNKNVINKKQYKENVDNLFKDQMNPKFEFEERVRGNIPLNKVKLIDFLTFPDVSEDTFNAYKMMNFLPRVLKKNIPIIRSERTTNSLMNLRNKMVNENSVLVPSVNQLLKTPTYKNNPFRNPKITVWDEKLQKIITIDNPY
tara:strand:- start:45 stop:1130 length:1086 start_codon:yes stop_codon:yes gene_type:complete